MGVEVQKEAEYKYRCIRARKKKEASNGIGLGIRDAGSTSPIATSAVSVSGSAALNGVIVSLCGTSLLFIFVLIDRSAWITN
jgi:protein-serine/threonine kinase